MVAPVAPKVSPLAPARFPDLPAVGGVRLAAAAAGVATVLISTDLDEILDLADRVAVLRRGRLVADLPAAGLDPVAIAALMVGSPASAAEPVSPGEVDGEALATAVSRPRAASVTPPRLLAASEADSSSPVRDASSARYASRSELAMENATSGSTATTTSMARRACSL